MNYSEKIQTIVDLIEEHLQRREEPIQMSDIERIAGCSLNFFQKVFSYTHGIPLAEYIRNRKMTLAGYDILSTTDKVIEISLKYGYESPTSFTKAFAKFHGLTPKDARKMNCKLRVYPKFIQQNQPQFHWEIVAKKAFAIVGKQACISKENQQHVQGIPAFWNACQRDGTFSHFITIDEAQTKGMFGLFLEEDEKAESVTYMIGVSSHQEEGAKVEIGAHTWVIFDCRGRVPDAIQEGWKFLTEEWLVQYPFQHADACDIEWYSDGNIFDENYHSQIWIPIKEEI